MSLKKKKKKKNQFEKDTPAIFLYIPTAERKQYR